MKDQPDHLRMANLYWKSGAPVVLRRARADVPVATWFGLASAGEPMMAKAMAPANNFLLCGGQRRRLPTACILPYDQFVSPATVAPSASKKMWVSSTPSCAAADRDARQRSVGRTTSNILQRGWRSGCQASGDYIGALSRSSLPEPLIAPQCREGVENVK